MAFEVLKVTVKDVAKPESILDQRHLSIFILDLSGRRKYCHPLLQNLKDKTRKNNFIDAMVTAASLASLCTLKIR